MQMDMAFEVPSPGVTVLFGPSGAGKSTVILAAAGLLRPDACQIEVDGQVMADTASGCGCRRNGARAGLVFQDAKLFPHMSVATNLRFGMRRAPRRVQLVSMTSWSCWASRRCSIAARTRCRAASGSVWRSAARCWRSRVCC